MEAVKWKTSLKPKSRKYYTMKASARRNLQKVAQHLSLSRKKADLCISINSANTGMSAHQSVCAQQ